MIYSISLDGNGTTVTPQALMCSAIWIPRIGSMYGQPFVQRRKLLSNLCKRARVEPFGYHDIRHTVAKYLNDLQKVGLKKVQQVLRHRRQTATEIYVEGNYTDTRDAMSLLEVSNLQNLE